MATSGASVELSWDAAGQAAQAGKTKAGESSVSYVYYFAAAEVVLQATEESKMYACMTQQ